MAAGCGDTPSVDDLPRPDGATVITDATAEGVTSDSGEIRYVLLAAPEGTTAGEFEVAEHRELRDRGWQQDVASDGRWEARSPDGELLVTYQADHCGAAPDEIQESLRAERPDQGVLCATIAKP